MADRNVIIIGAGIAGLCAGCYLQMNGYPTTIMEMGSTPGGLCTSRKRNGYTFDGCIQWLHGATPASPLYTYWLEVGALRDGKIYKFPEFKKTEYAPGKFFSMFTDADWLGAEMHRIVPEDHTVIEEFIEAIKRSSRAKIPVDKAFEIFTPIDWIKAGIEAKPLIATFRRYGKMTVFDFAKRFQSPILSEHFADMMGIDGNLPVAVLISTSGWMHAGGAGFPVGGSLAFARSIETHYRRLGGTVRYQCQVKRILTENGRATGVELENGEKRKADIVISAADGVETLHDLLEGKYPDPETEANIAQGRLFQPTLQVSVGVGRLLKEASHTVRYLTVLPIRIDDTHTVTALDTTIYNFDATLAYPGKTTIGVLIPTDYDYWNQLSTEDPDRYEKEKVRIGGEVVRALEVSVPDIAGAVEYVDVMTPVATFKATRNYRASGRGWFPASPDFRKRVSKTLPGLTGFYRIGHWTVPGGGLTSVLLTARHVTQILCRQDGRRFTIRT